MHAKKTANNNGNDTYDNNNKYNNRIKNINIENLLQWTRHYGHFP